MLIYSYIDIVIIVISLVMQIKNDIAYMLKELEQWD